MTNKEIAKKFRLLAALMELHEENSFKIKSYTNAAYAVERLDMPAADMPPIQLHTIQGIGAAISDKITALIQKGTFPLLDQLLEKTPNGIVTMLGLKGIGPKKIRTLWKELSIEDMGELLYACNENRLVALNGFGVKTQENIRQSIEYAQANAHKFRYATIAADADQLVSQIAALPNVLQVSLTGETRRKCEIISSLSLLIALAPNHQDAQNEVTMAIKRLIPENSPLENWQGIQLFFVEADNFAQQLFLDTATEAHLQQLFQQIDEPLDNIPTDFPTAIPNLSSEKDIYAHFGLPYILPELREGRDEIAFIKNIGLDNLIQLSDLKGIIHAHSTYSDGRHTLKQMAEFCKKAGYEYLGISDHSKAAFYANGLSVERIAEQHKEIDLLNGQLAPFKIFKGIEADILNDGQLDYDDDILATFDFVIASIHSNLKMNEEKAMNRLIKAIENPYTTILGHLTGRLLLSREGYPINHQRVIDACAANQVVIELNANPHRLDIDWRWINYCMKKNVLISINPDAHSTDGVSDMKYGVYAAQKGLLTRQMTFNALTRAELECFLAKKQK